MPNWCTTKVTISGPIEQMELLDEKFQEVQKNAKIKTDFGENWLGHILDYLDEWNNGNPTCRCRGWYSSYLSKSEGIMEVDVDSAWHPQIGAIVKLANKYAPDAEIMYWAIEPGCLLYFTNDPAYDGLYVLDVWDEDSAPDVFTEDTGCFAFLDEFDIRDILIEALGKTDDEYYPTETLISQANEMFGEYLSINKFEWVELGEVI